MQFHTHVLAVMALLAATASAMPVSVQSNGGMLRDNHTKRIPCPDASELAASADYKRDTALEEDEDLGDDSPGAVIACNF
ncbi:hypothetical protein F5X96DRAFT_666198 [Biscogniauxia mediterranea]|nr:hypothetical protein F5X96DRAFT_666198 [Biscogniauxia mediterranea]